MPRSLGVKARLGGRWRLAAALSLLLLAASLASFRLGYSLGYERGAESAAPPGSCSVLYIDMLGEDYPNPGLASLVASTLEGAGCSVTVIPASAFTIHSLSLLKYYDVVIFRGHTGWANYLNPETGEVSSVIGLFTGERYEPGKYRDLQARGLVVEGIPLARPVGYNKSYIAVTQQYIEKYVDVKEGSVYVLSTCFAGSRILAGILLQKGASLVIGWRGNVTVYHADKTLARLVQLYAETRDWAEAARRLPLDLKVDPATGATLQVYASQPQR
ncbi:hypothetical protein [Stetteria hydrogenophila]